MSQSGFSGPFRVEWGLCKLAPSPKEPTHLMDTLNIQKKKMLGKGYGVKLWCYWEQFGEHHYGSIGASLRTFCGGGGGSGDGDGNMVRTYHNENTKT